MFRTLLVKWVLLAAAIWITAALLPGIHVRGGVLALLWVAVLFALVNVVAGTLLRVVTFPLLIITFGLFALVVNAALVGLTAWLSDHFDVDGFWWAVAAGLLITVFSAILEAIFWPRRVRH